MSALFNIGLEPYQVLIVAVVVLAAMVLLAHLEDALRRLVAWVFGLIAIPAAYVARALLQFVDYLAPRIADGLDGLTEEAHESFDPGEHWEGWFLVGPLLYAALTILFGVSDFTVTSLAIHDMLGLGNASGGPPTLPLGLRLDLAVGLLFIALSVAFGMILFDLLELTPFAYIWSRLSERGRHRLASLVIGLLALNLLTGALLGLWRQWQVASSAPPEPWNTWIPPISSGMIVVLSIAATALCGKPIGSSLTGLWLLLLLAVRIVCFALIAVLRLVVMALRLIMRVVLAIISLAAHLGRKFYNWLVSYRPVVERVHLSRLPEPCVVEEPGGDLDEPVIRPAAAVPAASAS